MAGLFSSAKSVPVAPKASRKPVATEVPIKGMEKFAAIKAAIKSLTALAAVEEVAIKGQMTAEFIATGTAAKARPVNFKGVENSATGSCQLKVRTAASVLTADEVKLLDANSIPHETIVRKPECFLINPLYTNDMVLLAKVEAALANVDLPEDFLMKQEEESVEVTNEASIDAVFTKTAAEAELLLPMVSVLAVLPSITGNFWPILDKVMSPETAAA